MIDFPSLSYTLTPDFPTLGYIQSPLINIPLGRSHSVWAIIGSTPRVQGTYPRVVMVTKVYQKAAGMLINSVSFSPFSK